MNQDDKNKEVATQEKRELQPFEQEAVNKLMLKGDLNGLTQHQQVFYYTSMCKHLGLDPLTQPFSILELQGKKTLYANKSCANQLNQLHKISHKIVERKKEDGLYIVVCRAFTTDGRETEAIGALSITEYKNNEWRELQGNNLANALMKAETKAKRRATLDLVGLGMPDRTEAESIQDVEYYNINPQTGEQVKETPFYKQKVGTAEEAEKIIPQLTTVVMCGNFYAANTELFEGNEELKKAIKIQRDSVDPEKASTADAQPVQEAEVVEDAQPKQKEEDEQSDFKM